MRIVGRWLGLCLGVGWIIESKVLEDGVCLLKLFLRYFNSIFFAYDEEVY